MIDIRSLQLKKQAEIDKKLALCPCQDEVARYLLHRRAINRNQTLKVKNGGVLNMWKNINQNLMEIEEEHRRILEILDTDISNIGNRKSNLDITTCENLKKHTDKCGNPKVI